jgi:hypothetical protein
MKRQMLRVGLVVFIALCGLAVLGYSIDQAALVEIAESPVIDRIAPSISAAAGMELAQTYLDKSQAELETLVVEGATLGIRTAARMALSIVYSTKTVVELTALATGDVDPAIREAAATPLQDFLVEMESDDVLQLAISGATEEIRLAAADIYYLKNIANLTVEGLEASACDSESDELEYMAGVYLGGFYLSFTTTKTQAEAEALAMWGECVGLRVAGATALTTHLIRSDMAVEDLELVISGIDADAHPELLMAYQDALVVAYGR